MVITRNVIILARKTYMDTMYKAKVHQQFFVFVLLNMKRLFLSFLFCLPTSLLALTLILLLVYNGLTVFYVHLSFPSKFQSEPANFSAENLAGNPLKKISSSVMFAVKEENPLVVLKIHLLALHNQTISASTINHQLVTRLKKVPKPSSVTKVLHLEVDSKQFSPRIKDFFQKSVCKVRVFMTWIFSLEPFGDRECFAVESLFNSNPNACLVIVSNSMDSVHGNLFLKPFVDKGFEVIAIKPDFEYLFKNTYAEPWFTKLKKGDVDPGEISLGQNLSNLLRLALLYKYGGTYIDTDVIVLKSLSKLRNVIGAQTIDLKTGKWSRLNNAVLVFDKKHPLLFKFIEEFALTFDGNKWGHNGPYLVSRVVSRVTGRPGFNFTVLPPSAFYPVEWSRIGSIFRGPGSEPDSEWLHKKLEQIKRESVTVHLWNKHSRKIQVENGSIVDHIMMECCILCNSSRPSL